MIYISLVYLFHIDGLVQERRNSTANALELRHSCTNPIDIISVFLSFELAFQDLSVWQHMRLWSYVVQSLPQQPWRLRARQTEDVTSLLAQPHRTFAPPREKLPQPAVTSLVRLCTNWKIYRISTICILLEIGKNSWFELTRIIWSTHVLYYRYMMHTSKTFIKSLNICFNLKYLDDR